MGKNGGYVIIDFKDYDIAADTGATITGVYEALEGTQRKAVQITNVVIAGAEERDCFVCPTVKDSDFTFTAYGKTFTVTSDDLVTAS